MEVAKLFANGRSQAVRLPKAYRFEGDEVFVKKYGDMVLLLPRDSPWNSLVECLDRFSDDFMDERSQPGHQEREPL